MEEEQIMKKTMILKKLGLTIGGLVLALSLTGCSTNSSVKSSSDNSSKSATSSSVVTKKADKKTSSQASSTSVAATSSTENDDTAAAASTSQSSSSQVATTTPGTSSESSSNSTSEVVPTNKMTVISNFAKAAGYYGSTKYSFMVTSESGSDYTIEVRAIDGDSQVQSLVGIFDYNLSTNTYTPKY